MKRYPILFLKLIAILILYSSCSADSTTRVSGTIDYVGDSEFYIEIPPLHYKYSKKERINLTVENGSFDKRIELKSPQLIWIVLQDIQYPVFVEPAKDLEISIKRARFPFGVNIVGPSSVTNELYQTFLKETDGLDATINVETDKFKVGEKNTALSYSSIKLESAESNFKDTSFEPLYFKTIGEDLVLKLRAIEYSARFISSFDEDAARQKVLKEAKAKGFFELNSLIAQRAGIRDFTHYYSRTFGIYDSVVAAHNESLAEYDIKQVAYNELNEKRLQVLKYIENRDAKAYAEMFLVAERIGEQSMEISEPTYEAYLSEYPDYTYYIEFLTYFYNEIKSVSPGQPAIPFSISDRDGDFHTLDEYSGKFVLLDFWAGWCQPCLVEFPHMREIYKKYSRNEFEILGISTEVDSLVWIQDITRFKNPWPQLYGGKGMDQKTFKAYKGGGIPFYILVDPVGNIARYNDIRPSFNFTEVLDSLLHNYKNETVSPE